MTVEFVCSTRQLLKIINQLHLVGTYIGIDDVRSFQSQVVFISAASCNFSLSLILKFNNLAQTSS